MDIALLIISALGLIGIIILAALVFSLKDEVGRIRSETLQKDTALRQELNEAAIQTRAELRQSLGDFTVRLEAMRETVDALVLNLREEVSRTRAETLQKDATLRQELNEAAIQTRSDLRQSLGDFALRLEAIRETVEKRLTELQTRNEAKLEEMRKTVDEKLQTTLERRLGESFKLVSERLELVHRGLGEMQQIAAGVGDLKKVLTNIKTRGTWGEVQLGALLEQVLTAEQYGVNIAPKPRSAERVEYAIKLPGREEGEVPVWLPIDAKFPQEDYQRLVEASDRGDAMAAELAIKALEARLRQQARDIRDKYLAPPYTTDFGILFLPSEGLYAEALRRPGLADTIQQESRVVLAGPTTLAALLNSLQMGFRTLAIQKRSSEVWKVLGAVKTEFGRFGEVLDKVKEKLDQASKQIEDTQHRSRQIDKRLRDVEALPANEPNPLPPDLSDE